jgi:hypothetical protein
LIVLMATPLGAIGIFSVAASAWGSASHFLACSWPAGRVWRVPANGNWPPPALADGEPVDGQGLCCVAPPPGDLVIEPVKTGSDWERWG